MKSNIEIKQVVLYVAILMAFVLPLGNAAFGFTPSGDSKVSAANQHGALQLSGEWIQTNWTESNSYFNLSSSNNKVFARTWDSFNGGRMFFTTAEGTNWTQIGSADSSIDILSIVMLDSRMLAGTWDGLFQSTDNGTTWSAFTATGIPADAVIWSIVMMNTTLYAGTTGHVYKSADKGNTWTEIGSGIAADARITSIVASGDNLFAGSASNGVFKWTNSGTGWSAMNTNLTDTHISQLVVLDDKLYAVTLTGVYLSDNGGTSWDADPAFLDNVNCFVAVNDQLVAGTDGNSAYLLANNVINWAQFSPGMPADTRIWSLAECSDRIFAGTSSGIWVTDSPTDVNEISSSSAFMMKQNYPNPFNASTTFSFSIPSKSFVSLKVYDLQGREVATVFSEEIAEGAYSRQWNAADLSGGIYFYRLQAGSWSETKKLILVR